MKCYEKKRCDKRKRTGRKEIKHYERKRTGRKEMNGTKGIEILRKESNGTKGIEILRKETNGAKGIEILRKETNGTKGIEILRMETMRYDEGRMDERKRSGMIGNERKTIVLLLFAGIEPTGTIFQTIHNLLLKGNFTTPV